MIATNRSFDEHRTCNADGCSDSAHQLSELRNGPFCAHHECHKLVDAMLFATDDDDVTELMPELSIWIERARLEAK